MKTKTLLALGASALLAWTGHAATYLGNGNTGFGGAVGQGSLLLTDDGTTLYGTFTRGSGNFNDALVIYIDSVSGGASSTLNYTDSSDGLRRAISGYNGTDRSVLTMPAGFLPDYAIALGPASDSYGGLWALVEGASHTWLAGVSLTPLVNNAATYTFSLSLASIGSPLSFKLLGTYISNTGYRSDEALATTVSGVQGWNPFTADGYGIYVVPEPSTVALLSLGGLLAAGYAIRRRRQ